MDESFVQTHRPSFDLSKILFTIKDSNLTRLIARKIQMMQESFGGGKKNSVWDLNVDTGVMHR